MRRIVGTPRTPRGLQTAGIFIVFVLAYALLRTISPIDTAFRYLEHGFVVIGTGVGNVISRVVRSEESITSALAICEQRLQEAAVRQAELADEAKSVQELEALIGYIRQSGTTGVAARIVTRSLPEASSVTIDKGTDDGLVEGNAVVVADGHLFGVITDAREHTSDVRLVHSKTSSVPAAILGKTRTIGLIEGQEGSLLKMEYIPEDAVVNEGDIVITSGLEGGLPQGIVIGMITAITKVDTAPFLEALIEPLYDARIATNVLVVQTVK